MLVIIFYSRGLKYTLYSTFSLKMCFIELRTHTSLSFRGKKCNRFHEKLLECFLFSPFLCCFQNILRGCSVLLGSTTSGLWRALAQSQNHILGGGPAELTELLEQYTQNLAQNMKLTYLNPVALVSPNIGEFRAITHRQRWRRSRHYS